jgi:hypothetical protein
MALVAINAASVLAPSNESAEQDHYSVNPSLQYAFFYYEQASRDYRS